MDGIDSIDDVVVVKVDFQISSAVLNVSKLTERGNYFPIALH